MIDGGLKWSRLKNGDTARTRHRDPRKRTLSNAGQAMIRIIRETV
jgi:hypothetical protein